MNENLKIGVIGASGFIGKHLLELLRANGHHAVAFTRRSGVFLEGAAETRVFNMERAPVIGDLDAVVNLAGSPILRRWSAKAKKQILDSRVLPTRKILRTLANTCVGGQGPTVLVNASGIGFYGDQGPNAQVITESAPPGFGFLARTAAIWENEAVQGAAEIPNLRTITLRIGFVIGPDGGAIPLMRTPFKCFMGGYLGNGHQWMSWIHVTDLARLILFIIQSPGIEGPVNAVAPKPVTNREFTKAFAKAVHRPALFPVPGFLLRLILGEMAELVLSSHRVASEKISEFSFVYPDVVSALQAGCEKPARFISSI